MKVTVNKDRCKECGLCIHHCPRKAISKCDVLNANGYYPVQVDDEACIAWRNVLHHMSGRRIPRIRKYRRGG